MVPAILLTTSNSDCLHLNYNSNKYRVTNPIIFTANSILLIRRLPT